MIPSDILEKVGTVNELETGQTDSVTSNQLLNSQDKYDNILFEALKSKGDLQYPLYKHQYDALYNLALGNDVLLIQPCGKGKTRVEVVGPEVVRRGFNFRGSNLDESQNKCVVLCPLSSIIVDKISDDEKSGMIMMTGKTTVGDSEDEGTLNRPEQDFSDSSIQYIHGHAESYTTVTGKRILKVNKDKIVMFTIDEASSPFMWGIDFRPELLIVPGILRVHGIKNAPLLAMTATLRQNEIKVLLNKFCMDKRNHVIIQSSPILSGSFFGVILRPSNRTDFYDDNGLKSQLDNLYLKQYIDNPLESKVAIMFFRSEDKLTEVYLYLENKLSKQFPVNSRRPFVQGIRN